MSPQQFVTPLTLSALGLGSDGDVDAAPVLIVVPVGVVVPEHEGIEIDR